MPNVKSQAFRDDKPLAFDYQQQHTNTHRYWPRDGPKEVLIFLFVCFITTIVVADDRTSLFSKGMTYLENIMI